MSFHPTLAALSKKSSTQWIARQRRDHYVKQRASSAYKSRSAFKLLELDSQLSFLDHDDVNVVVDLGAAPGGWSQVVSQRLGYGSEEDSEPLPSTLPRVRSKRRPAESSRPGSDYDPLNIDRMEEEIARSESKGRGTVVAVDLLPMNPIPGVRSLQKDFLDPKTDAAITDLLHSSIPGLRQRKMGKALVDVVLSDMAPNISGNALHDSEESYRLCLAVQAFAARHLRTEEQIGRRYGGVLVLKHFSFDAMNAFRKEKLEPHFSNVQYIKPPASRSESSESYFVCRGWNPVREVPMYGILPERH
ncbi:ribosomal RNA large subunit methyltransferase J [Desarmillaria tabescens]|uniref:rRNA methyltransferase 2, mitochondrial n=1 Tax=Armillaria tabescens TaxID=1929756 RepID=A0AA39JN96_ARMTA|nr:ribosomal RNA large subunit methyltransferase J [Desarmillaria tabescens]KAK0444990.1 ribosomal RNA large subunit methyltransferase J [Desarmillaria tabescens]